jgi:iron complex outermembrane receptor protein
LNTLTYTAQYLPVSWNGFSTTFGLNGMRQQNSNAGVEQLIPDYRLFDIGAYVYAKKQIGKLNWSGGLRFDSRSMDAGDLLDGADVKNPGFTRQFSNVSGSVGLAAQLTPQLNVKLNAARAFRAPSIPELASNGAHEGTTRYEYGNIDLRSETSMQVDAGFEFNSLHASFNISGYHNNFSNFIFYRKLSNAVGTDSLVDVDGESLTAFTFDQRAAVLSGMEVTVDIHPHPLDWLHIANTFSFVSGRFKNKIENSSFLPFMPAPRLLTELRAQFNQGQGTIRNGYAQLTLDNNFAQDNIFAAYNTETATPGYTLLGLGLGADFYSNRQARLFSLFFSASNLTDVAYQQHLSRLKYTAVNEATGRMGVFNMGRNFSIRLLVPLQFPIHVK